MSVPIVASNVDCTGSEAGLGSCPYSTTLVDCGHHQDAGVRCPETCSGNSVRLINGSNEYNGRVEVCYNGYFGTICQDNWSIEDARVVCRQLGFSTASK